MRINTITKHAAPNRLSEIRSIQDTGFRIAQEIARAKRRHLRSLGDSIAAEDRNLGAIEQIDIEEHATIEMLHAARSSEEMTAIVADAAFELARVLGCEI